VLDGPFTGLRDGHLCADDEDPGLLNFEHCGVGLEVSGSGGHHSGEAIAFGEPSLAFLSDSLPLQAHYDFFGQPEPSWTGGLDFDLSHHLANDGAYEQLDPELFSTDDWDFVFPISKYLADKICQPSLPPSGNLNTVDQVATLNAKVSAMAPPDATPKERPVPASTRSAPSFTTSLLEMVDSQGASQSQKNTDE
jgi:hypothetical protein